MISASSAKLLNLSGYGIEVGAVADLVVIDAVEPAMAVAELVQPLYGFKGGRHVFTRDLPKLYGPN
jgi:cytosine deaminase